MTTRMLPPVAQTMQTITVNGTVYSAKPGAAVDVADADVDQLRAAGWIVIAASGASGARPTALRYNSLFFDTTLQKMIAYDGSSWRDITTGGKA